MLFMESMLVSVTKSAFSTQASAAWWARGFRVYGLWESLLSGTVYDIFLSAKCQVSLPDQS